MRRLYTPQYRHQSIHISRKFLLTTGVTFRNPRRWMLYERHGYRVVIVPSVLTTRRRSYTDASVRAPVRQPERERREWKGGTIRAPLIYALTSLCPLQEVNGARPKYRTNGGQISGNIGNNIVGSVFVFVIKAAKSLFPKPASLMPYSS